MASAAASSGADGVMQLSCALVDDQSVFSVVVPKSARVRDLQVAICEAHARLTDTDPLDLILYQARKSSDSPWLGVFGGSIAALQRDRFDGYLAPSLVLRSTWQLCSEQFLGDTDAPGPDTVQVLVDAPSSHAATNEVRSAKRPKLAERWMWKTSDDEPAYSIARGSMFFVERERPIEQLQQLHKNKFERVERDLQSDWVVPLVDSISGMGKTAFAMHYIRKCRETWPSAATRTPFEKALCSCHTVRIALKPGSLAKDDASLNDVVLAALVAELRTMFEPSPRLLGEAHRSVASFLRALTSEVGPLFIVVDDVGAAFDDGALDDVAKRDRFFLLYSDVISAWLSIKSVFFVIIGSAPFFGYVKATQSEFERLGCTFARLDLRLLSPDAIAQIMKTTCAAGAEGNKTVQRAARLTERQVETASHYLWKATCGHPRELLSAFQSCRTLGELMSYTHTLTPEDYDELVRNVARYKPLVEIFVRRAMFDRAHRDEDDGGSTLTIERRVGSSDGASTAEPLAVVASKIGVAWEGPMKHAKLYIMPSVCDTLVQLALSLPEHITLLTTACDDGSSVDCAYEIEKLCMRRLADLFAAPSRPEQVLPAFFRTPMFGKLRGVQFAASSLAPVSTQVAPSVGALPGASRRSNGAHPACDARAFDDSSLSDRSTTGQSRRASASSTRVLMAELPSKQRLVVRVAATSHTSATKVSMQRLRDEQDEFLRVLSTRGDDLPRLSVLILCASKYETKLRTKFDASTHSATVEPKHPGISEIVLLDLSSTATRKAFFGLTGAHSAALDRIFAGLRAGSAHAKL